MNEALCIFISSSDNTYDVFDSCYQGNRPFIDSDKFEVLVGLNYLSSNKFITINSDLKSGWASELYDQLKKINYKYVLLLLDDFYFYKQIDSIKILEYFELASTNNYKYLRLIERDGAWIVKKFRAISQYKFKSCLIPPNDEYYSSLQPAIWERAHLMDCLITCGSIWDFECQLADLNHYAIGRNFLKYEHVVEKGKWLRVARQLNLVKPGLHREFSPLGFMRQGMVPRLKFAIFGYWPKKFKRKLCNLFQ